MRTLIIAVALTLLPWAVSAQAQDHRGRTINTAKDLTQSLYDVSSSAQRIAQKARYEGMHQRAQKFKRLSRATQNLSQQLRMKVVRPLRQGARLGQVDRAFQSLNYQFRNANQLFQSIRRVPPRFQNKVYNIKSLKQKLTRMLKRRPGPGPGPGRPIQCTAVDRGWEEHRGGHTATGPNRMIAERKAMQLCQRSHGQCRISNCQPVRGW